MKKILFAIALAALLFGCLSSNKPQPFPSAEPSLENASPTPLYEAGASPTPDDEQAVGQSLAESEGELSDAQQAQSEVDASPVPVDDGDLNA